MDAVGLLAAIAVMVGPFLGWLRLIPALPSFYLYGLGGILAVVAAASALFQLARGRRIGLGRAVALPTAMLFIIAAAGGVGAPTINDFTTNLEDPPSFRRATALPENAGRDLVYPAAYAEQQRVCCSDLRAARIQQPPAQAFEIAVETARAMPGWEVGSQDPSSGEIEAVATSRVFGFRDDIVIRARAQTGATVIDVRSKSRDGRGDLGANADRIRRFVERLEAAAATAKSGSIDAPAN